jgi:hypothetical protein
MAHEPERGGLSASRCVHRDDASAGPHRKILAWAVCKSGPSAVTRTPVVPCIEIGSSRGLRAPNNGMMTSVRSRWNHTSVPTCISEVPVHVHWNMYLKSSLNILILNHILVIVYSSIAVHAIRNYLGISNTIQSHLPLVQLEGCARRRNSNRQGDPPNKGISNFLSLNRNQNDGRSVEMSGTRQTLLWVALGVVLQGGSALDNGLGRLPGMHCPVHFVGS